MYVEAVYPISKKFWGTCPRFRARIAGERFRDLLDRQFPDLEVIVKLCPDAEEDSLAISEDVPDAQAEEIEICHDLAIQYGALSDPRDR